MRICVYGAASAELAEVYLKHAYQLGEALAAKHIGLVYGGGGAGVMGAVAQGAYDRQGEIIGVSPEFFRADGVLFDGCTQMIYTKTMRHRKQQMEDLADGFIMAPGGMGTFEEFFEILTLKQLGQHSKPIAILNTQGYYDGLIQFMEYSIRQKFMKPACRDLFFVSDDIEEVLQYVCKEEQQATEDITKYKAVILES